MKHGELNDLELCYVAALLYGIRLIDEKAERRGELVIPREINNYRYKCKPEIDCKALREFVRIVGDRIATANFIR